MTVRLATPDVRFHRSFLAAVDEFRAAGEAAHDGVVNWPAEGDFPGIVFTREGLEASEEFARLVANRVGDAEEGGERPPGWTTATCWWMEDPDRQDEFVGSISLRHHIDHPMLSTVGGHVGYSVRPAHGDAGSPVTRCGRWCPWRRHAAYRGCS